MANLSNLVVTDWIRYGSILIVEAQDTVKKASHLLVYKDLKFDDLIKIGKLSDNKLFQNLENTSESWKAVVEYCKQHEVKVCPCCHKSVGNNSGNYYKSTSYLWNKYGVVPTKKNHMLCLACFENRVGRKLDSDDFSSSLLNSINPIYKKVVDKEHVKQRTQLQ